MTISEFAWVVFIYCTMTGASVTSWIRSPKHNAGVGGVWHSPHLVGVGVDVVYDEPMPLAARQEWADRAGLALFDEGDHDHLQPIGWKAN